jgi:hypothetical protein
MAPFNCTISPTNGWAENLLLTWLPYAVSVIGTLRLCIGVAAGVTGGLSQPPLSKTKGRIMEESNKHAGIDGDDQANMKLVMEGLIDQVVKFNSQGFTTDEDYAEFMADLDHASFIVNGVIYKNGIDLCAGIHEMFDEDEDDGAVE